MFGLYYHAVQARFPKFDAAMVAAPNLIPWPALTLPNTRALYIDANDTRLVQLQQDMFYTNWRRMRPEDEYPHYEAQRELFISEWAGLLSLLEDVGIAHPSLALAQVSYVNHVPIPTGKTMGDVLNEVFGIWRPFAAPAKLGTARAGSLLAVYGLPETNAELTLQVAQVIRATDNVNMVQFQLTVTHRLTERDDGTLILALDKCHNSVETAFLSLTSEAARSEWGQED